ncbi:MAG: phosphohydrolase [Burkholderiales bacterium]|nr:phosphohydrolase [Burkholderiales bacterium]
MNERVPLGLVAALMAPGRPLPFRVLDGQGRLLLAAGQTIQDADQLRLLLERGACADADEVEEARARHVAEAAGASPVPSQRRLTWFDHYEREIWTLDDLLRRCGRDAALAPELDAFVGEHIDRAARQLDAALFMAVRQDHGRTALYALTHALHTATIVLLTSRQLGWDAMRERSAVAAALTMNASTVELQAKMAEQNDPPSAKQMAQIRAHPHLSAQMLRASGVTDTDWLTAVEDHHERAGTHGYPRGTGDIGEIARVLRAADVYAAKISPRALRAPLLPQIAARQLYEEEQGGPLAGALIKAVGIYPPGDFVTLKNGEIGVVALRAQGGAATQVTALLDGRGRPVAGSPRRDGAAAGCAIAGTLVDRSRMARVLPEQVYGLLEA